MDDSRPRRRTRLRLAALAGLACAAIAVCVVAVLAAEHTSSGSSSPLVPAGLPKGARAPAFDLPRLGGGDRVTLAGFAGHPLVINFFASDCTDCTAELAAFAAAWRDLRGHVGFVGIDSADPAPDSARKLLAAAGDGYPVGYDRYAQTSYAYLVPGLPMTVFVDPAGRVVDVALGSQTAAEVEHWAGYAASH